MPALIELSGVTIGPSGGRALFADLDLRIEREHVALVGRNGVGKSTLLAVLAGEVEPRLGRVRLASTPYFVPQAVPRGRELSEGEARRRDLDAARESDAEILLLDEPSEHLDDAAVAWLRGWLRDFAGCAIVASHDTRLLADFRHFFVVSESGCRYFAGSLAELDEALERDHHALQERYVRNLQRLASASDHTERVTRRRARKKRSGRARELDRCTPRIRLNQKRDHAQVYQGRLAKLREARLAELRDWTRATRRALNVSLSLELDAPALPALLANPASVLELRCVTAHSRERALFGPLDLDLGRQHVAVVGPNGAGKTTLLQIALGERRADAGTVRREPARMGHIAQGGANWALPESLFELLARETTSRERAARALVAHKFPLALAERPLSSLSPGERTRAALICLFERSPTLELLVLDEPSYSLDRVGQRALVRALRAWPGGLLVTSHDREFLGQLDPDTVLELGGVG